ncbi:uncharacterized protein MELLADRAFT_107547 [Melampsora larici-populina 98AG31]|uniref:Secreted protein n=1 Tax=Melampsora larici-populina (strain 98AG31 / pathotype 3-4-7) TaxID=747676 RepID=F4RQM3_MELLP|nr:uncharacterized protein MELLADRAFT_107547 [Melampsora larici-populina 98AG31]EGG05489.1 secreted protein [Melampsora larici-populina 98AG31]
MQNLHLLSILLCLFGILAPVFTQTQQDRDIIHKFTGVLASYLQAGQYKSIYDMMGAGATVTVDNQIFGTSKTVSNRDDFAGILYAYKSFAPISLASIDTPVYLSTPNFFKVKIGAVLGLKVNPFGTPIRLETVITFKTKHPKLGQVQSAKLTVHK